MSRLLTILATLLVTFPINACQMHSKMRLADILAADEVFIGKLMDYELSKGKGLSQYSILRFKVTSDVYNSSAGNIKEVYWHNSTFGVPKSLEYKTYLVAITNGKQPILRGPSATIFPPNKNKANLLQAPCSSPFLLEPTRKNVDQIKEIIASKDPNSKSSSSTFEFHSNGNIYVNTDTCDGSVGRTKLAGVNHLKDDVERISSMFIRVNSKLYDAYSAEFQRYKIDKTHNIENAIVEKDFRVIDKEKQYFTDGENYFYYKYYPTSRACLRYYQYTKEFSSIRLSEFKLNDPMEAGFYLSQRNNIFTSDGSYTPFAKLKNELYFKNKDGKFTKVIGANPKDIRELGSTYGSFFYTDGTHIIFQGKVMGLMESFKQIEAGTKRTPYYEIENKIYHLHVPANARYFGSILTKTDIDANSFEAIDSTGSYSGITYQDKDFVYKLKNAKTKYEEVKKYKRNR